MNREDWLHEVTNEFRLWFELKSNKKVQIPKVVHISVGFPKGRHGVLSIGQCWSGERSADGNSHIFIHPKLEAFEATEVLIHELVHAAVGTHHGHGKIFKAMATLVGLVGKATATSAGDSLSETIQEVISSVGDYPHAVLEPRAVKARPGSKLYKAWCPDCGYTCRICRRWLVEPGPPICPCNGQPMKSQEAEW